MFRAQVNPMDEVVNKATDENLTSENWEYILDVCDKVQTAPSGASQVVSALIKRLAHRNANVQLYTLELANALSQNCGLNLHRELASKAFTDALLRLVADRTTHGLVKQKVLERMSSWAEEFRSNPDLGFMDKAYHELRTQQPGLHPPSKPTKTEISSEDRRKEEEELQMALALSVKDKGTTTSHIGQQSVRDDSEPQPAQAPAATQQGTTAATVSRVRALYDFTPSEAGELAFQKGDVIAVLESVYKDWWRGSLRGQSGIFPLNYVEKLPDPSKEELERDAQMEAEVFGEIKNVERLLSLLSVRSEGGGRRGEREEEEITDLYQRTLSIRPKLIELIGRYSQKKDDFTQLNERFIKARRDYEALLESSMSQTQYQQHPIRNRQPSYPPQHSHAPYGVPAQPHSQSYLAQQGPLANNQTYPTQVPFSPPSLQQNLLPGAAQRFSIVPKMGPPEHNAQPHGYNPSYQPSGHSAVVSPTLANGPAPFHFIPGGIQAQSQDIRRKPSPQGALNHTSGEPYTPISAFPGQARPNSIHTLNSGNPQELATTGYESPVDNRQGYPPPQMGPGGTQTGFEPYVHPNERPNNAESPHDTYSSPIGMSDQLHGSYAPTAAPLQPSGPPPAMPSSPDMSSHGLQGYPTYQAYQPTGQRLPSGGPPGAVSNDPGDFYR